MNYINDFHWAWYGIGFVLCPRLTIMIALSIHFKEFIPLPLMIIGWVIGLCSSSSIVSHSSKQQIG